MCFVSNLNSAEKIDCVHRLEVDFFGMFEGEENILSSSGGYQETQSPSETGRMKTKSSSRYAHGNVLQPYSGQNPMNDVLLLPHGSPMSVVSRNNVFHKVDSEINNENLLKIESTSHMARNRSQTPISTINIRELHEWDYSNTFSGIQLETKQPFSDNGMHNVQLLIKSNNLDSMKVNSSFDDLTKICNEGKLINCDTQSCQFSASVCDSAMIKKPHSPSVSNIINIEKLTSVSHKREALELLNSPTVPKRRKSRASPRKFGKPQTNKIDQYLIRRKGEELHELIFPCLNQVSPELPNEGKTNFYSQPIKNSRNYTSKSNALSYLNKRSESRRKHSEKSINVGKSDFDDLLNDPVFEVKKNKEIEDVESLSDILEDKVFQIEEVEVICLSSDDENESDGSHNLLSGNDVIDLIEDNFGEKNSLNHCEVVNNDSSVIVLDSEVEGCQKYNVCEVVNNDSSVIVLDSEVEGCQKYNVCVETKSNGVGEEHGYPKILDTDATHKSDLYRTSHNGIDSIVTRKVTCGIQDSCDNKDSEIIIDLTVSEATSPRYVPSCKESVVGSEVRTLNRCSTVFRKSVIVSNEKEEVINLVSPSPKRITCRSDMDNDTPLSIGYAVEVTTSSSSKMMNSVPFFQKVPINSSVEKDIIPLSLCTSGLDISGGDEDKNEASNCNDKFRPIASLQKLVFRSREDVTNSNPVQTSRDVNTEGISADNFTSDFNRTSNTIDNFKSVLSFKELQFNVHLDEDVILRTYSSPKPLQISDEENSKNIAGLTDHSALTVDKMDFNCYIPERHSPELVCISDDETETIVTENSMSSNLTTLSRLSNNIDKLNYSSGSKKVVLNENEEKSKMPVNYSSLNPVLISDSNKSKTSDDEQSCNIKSSAGRTTDLESIAWTKKASLNSKGKDMDSSQKVANDFANETNTMAPVGIMTHSVDELKSVSYTRRMLSYSSNRGDMSTGHSSPKPVHFSGGSISDNEEIRSDCISIVSDSEEMRSDCISIVSGSCQSSSQIKDNIIGMNKPALSSKTGESIGTDDFVALYKEVMYKYSEEAAHRMELKWITPCCAEPCSCLKFHRTVPNAVEVCNARACSLEAAIDENLWPLVFDMCSSITSIKTYPQATAVLRILDYILNTHDRFHIETAVATVKKIIDFHPPCAPDMLKYYTSILTASLGEVTPEISVNGIFEDIIFKLNNLIQSEESENKNLDSPGSQRNEDSAVKLDMSTWSNLESDYCSEDITVYFAKQEAAEKEKNFKTLDPSEKIERLFLLMDLLVEILELDLAVFLVKRSYNMKKALHHSSYKPLIVSTVWRTCLREGIGHVNQLCKVIIQLYVRCQQLRIDFENTNIITRLLTLVGELVWANDRCRDSKYPHFGECCKELAQEVRNQILDLNPEDLMLVLNDMMPSYLKLHVANLLLSNGEDSEPSLCTQLELLSRWPPSNCQNLAENQIVKTNNLQSLKSSDRRKKINKRNDRGETILHRLCIKNKTDELKEVLEDPEIDINVIDNYGWTALHEAALGGNVECLQQLLNYIPPPGKAKVNIRAKSEDGTTPLLDAVKNNRLECCKMLLKHGGPLLLKDRNCKGENALNIAVSPEMKALLEEAASQEYLSFYRDDPLPPLASLLVSVVIHSYLNTYQILQIKNKLKLYKTKCFNNVSEERKRSFLPKFDFHRFRSDFNCVKKLKCLVKQKIIEFPDEETLLQLKFLLRS